MERTLLAAGDGQRGQIAIELTRYMVHKHYCENDEVALVALFDDEVSWIGAGEGEYLFGGDEVKEIFTSFSGKVPRCILAEEHYDVLEVVPDVCICTGSMLITTDPAENIYLQARQRITAVFRWAGDKAHCCHLHVSNPYTDMDKDEIGFPRKIARQSHEYMRQCIEEQKRQLDAQTAELISIYNTVPCIILRLLRTPSGYQLLSFNKALEHMLSLNEEEIRQHCWGRGHCANVAPEDVQKLEKALAQLTSPGDSLSVDYRMNGPHGVVYMSCINTLISSDENGDIIQRIAFDISTRKEMESSLQRLSFEDTLTGLFNRNRFNQDMNLHAATEQGHIGLAYFDLNGLKEVNDSQGHSAGDELICRTARHLAAFFRGKVYRIGGDEFVVLDRDRDEESFREAVDNACRAMSRDGISIAVGVSWRSSAGDLMAQFNEADKSMYEEKNAFYGTEKRRVRT